MATYTPDQIARYFKRINFNPSDHPAPGSLEHLSHLLVHQLAAVPFENLSLHYSQTHLLSLDPEDLFVKIVDRNRGGYCMENNTFFGAVLRSLGYELINAGARIADAVAGKEGDGFQGWSHMVNLVAIGNTRYLVDVGFGRGNAVVPLPLVPGHEIEGWGEQRLRLEHRAIAQHSDLSQRLWVYSCRESERTPWKPCYAFSELEFFPADFEVMNLSTMTLRTSWFTQQVTCCRFLVDDSHERVIGVAIMFANRVRTIVVSQEEVMEEVKSEADRVAALAKTFGVALNAAECRGISGLSSELKAL